MDTNQTDVPQAQTQAAPPAVSNDLTQKLNEAGTIIQEIMATYRQLMVGQEDMLESILVTLISNGHLLLEGVPGLAKTTAAMTIASCFGADFVRIQCTPDMLPSDVIGTQIYNLQAHEFTTQLGPINHQFVLVDEVNRTGAKTQSALLEAMQERQVSIGGQTHALPKGFIVMATQNPIEQEGTYPLPEAQLDRFMFKHVLTYPTLEEEIKVLQVRPSIDTIKELRSTRTVKDILMLQDLANTITADERILRYAATIVSATRNPKAFGLDDVAGFIEVGASPRASLSLVAAGRAAALLQKSAYVTPDHIKPFLRRVLRHRLVLTYEAEANNITADQIIDRIGSVVPVP